jgi:hypothetical protein
MTKPVDLDALDAAYLDVSNGQWLIRRGVENFVHVIAEERSRVTGVAMTNDGFTARWIASSRNAYPALAAELRERRAREEAMAAELRALREVAEAARAFYGHVTEHHRTCPCCDVDDSSLCEPTCRFNALADALAKVPR